MTIAERIKAEARWQENAPPTDRHTRSFILWWGGIPIGQIEQFSSTDRYYGTWGVGGGHIQGAGGRTGPMMDLDKCKAKVLEAAAELMTTPGQPIAGIG